MNANSEDDKGARRSRGKSASANPKTIDLDATEVTRDSNKRDGTSKQDDTKNKPAEPDSDSKSKTAEQREATATSTLKQAASGTGFGRMGQASSNGNNTAKPRNGQSDGQASNNQENENQENSGAANKYLPLTLISAALGAIIALLLLAGLGASGVMQSLPIFGASQTDALDRMQQELREEMAGLRSDIESELTELRSQISNLPAAGPQDGTNETRIGELADSLAAVQSDMQQLEQRLSDSGTNSVEGAAPAIDTDRLESLEERVTQMESQIEAPGPAGNNTAFRQSIETRINDIESALDTATTQINQTEADLAARDARDSEMARQFAARAIFSAHRRGESISGLLDSLETLDIDPANLDTIRDRLSQGVASRQTLASEFDTIAGKIINADSQAESQGMVARLVDNARSLVRVRPAGPIEGDTPEAIVSRIEAALDSGELATAYDEWQKLPQPAREVSSQWADRLSGRIETDQEIEALISSLAGDS
jgi:hypothetical protein